MTVPKYDSVNYRPPAPVASVILRNPETGAEFDSAELLIDSGADLTALPLRALERLGVPTETEPPARLRGFDGRVVLMPVAKCEVLFQGDVFAGDFIVVNQARGFLGRDILNKHDLRLNGPGLEWSV